MLDTFDYGIIKSLQEDGRMPYADIGRHLGTSESTVRRRLERLVKEGFIKITVMPDPKKVGMNAIALIGLQVELNASAAAAQELAKKPEIQLLTSCTGPFDIMLLVMLPSLESLSSFLNGEVASIPGVRKSETFVVLEVHKSTSGFVPQPTKPARRKRAKTARKAKVVEETPRGLVGAASFLEEDADKKV